MSDTAPPPAWLCPMCWTALDGVHCERCGDPGEAHEPVVLALAGTICPECGGGSGFHILPCSINDEQLTARSAAQSPVEPAPPQRPTEGRPVPSLPFCAAWRGK